MGIMNRFDPQIYIADIINSNPHIVGQLTESYFLEREKSEEFSIQLEDESLDIVDPRNFLNVLLYLNETFNLEVKDILLLYCEQMLTHELPEIVFMVKQERVFEICEVDQALLNQLMIEKFREIFIASEGTSELLWKIVFLIN